MIIPELTYILITSLLAFVDYKRINSTFGKKENVNHYLSGILALVPIIILILTFRLSLIFLFCSFTIRAIFYEPILNKLRGKNIAYISTSTSSFIDKLEYSIFKNNFYLEKLFYIILLILFNII